MLARTPQPGPSPTSSPLPRSLSPVLCPLLGTIATALRADIFGVRLTWQEAGVVHNSLLPPSPTVTQLGDKQCQTPNPGPWASTRPGPLRIAMTALPPSALERVHAHKEQPLGPVILELPKAASVGEGGGSGALPWPSCLLLKGSAWCTPT